MSDAVVEAVQTSGPLAPQAPASAPLVSVPSAEQVTRMLASHSFQLRHSLGHSPLLSLPAIQDITKNLLGQRKFDQIMFDPGLPGSGARRADAESSGDLLEALDHYESRRAWLRLTRVDEIAPEFKEIVEQFYRDLSDLHKRDIKREVIKAFVTLFVSSPGAVTPYHIDHTWNYLLQISGHKTVHLFDQNDPLVLSQSDRENWYAQRTSVAQKPGASGIAYDLGPGDGVHHPVNAPHWVQNGSEVSVSLSLGLCLHRSTRDAQVYQANYMLRRLGLNPRPPRSSAWRDALKASFIRRVSDRSPKTFDDVLFSGMYRLRRLMKMVGLSRYTSAKKVEIT